MGENGFNVGKELLDDDGLLSDEAINEIVSIISEKLNGKIVIADPSVYRRIAVSLGTLKQVIECDNGALRYSVDNVAVGRVCLSINIRDGFTIKDGNVFAKAVAEATNFDVYPKIDGTIQIDVMFKTNVAVV